MEIDLRTQLMEKYLHSQGAAFYDEGRLDDGVSCFEQAIALDDRSYTRWHLSRVFVRKNQIERALQEIGRAITLNPQIARYYYERSRLEAIKGNQSEAELDLLKAIELDPNFTRIDEIRLSLKALEEAAADRRVADSHGERIHNARMDEILSGIEKGSPLRNAPLETLSCSLPCPAYCCYFEGNPLLHGLSAGPWKLLKIREFLKRERLAEEQFLDRTDLTGEGEIQKLIPLHHLLREKGRTCVYSPRKGGSRINPALLASLPKGREYQDLFWIHAGSWGCSFLRDRRCIIHDVGNEPALPACKEFLCLTGFVFAVLLQWNLIEIQSFQEKTMMQLNQVAIEAALIMARELFLADDLRTTRRSIEETIALFAKAEREGNSKEMDYLANLVEDLNNGFIRTVSAQKRTVRREVMVLLDSLTLP